MPPLAILNLTISAELTAPHHSPSSIPSTKTPQVVEHLCHTSSSTKSNISSSSPPSSLPATSSSLVSPSHLPLTLLPSSPSFHCRILHCHPSSFFQTSIPPASHNILFLSFTSSLLFSS